VDTVVVAPFGEFYVQTSQQGSFIFPQRKFIWSDFTDVGFCHYITWSTQSS